MLGKRIQFDDKRSHSLSSIEERADYAAEEWFESHSRPLPLKKHLQSVRKRRAARVRGAAAEAEELADS